MLCSLWLSKKKDFVDGVGCCFVVCCCCCFCVVAVALEM